MRFLGVVEAFSLMHITRIAAALTVPLIATAACSRPEASHDAESLDVPSYKVARIQRSGRTEVVLKGGPLCIPVDSMQVSDNYAEAAALSFSWPGLGPVTGRHSSTEASQAGIIHVIAHAGHPEQGKADRLLDLVCGVLVETQIPSVKDCSRNAEREPQGNYNYFVVDIPTRGFTIEPSLLTCSRLQGTSPKIANCRGTISGIPGTDYVLVDIPEQLLPQVRDIYTQVLNLLSCP